MPKNGVNKRNRSQSSVVSRLSAVFSSLEKAARRHTPNVILERAKRAIGSLLSVLERFYRYVASPLHSKMTKTVDSRQPTVYRLLPSTSMRRAAALALSATLIATASIPVLPTILPPQEVQAAWYNEDWRYRAPVDITSPTTQANVYMSLTLDTSNTNKFNPDCSDLRFVTRSGQLIPHHIASGCGTGSTQIQILFGELPAGDSQIYLYYGNSQASNTSIPEPFNNIADGTTGIIQAEESSAGPVAHWKFDEGYGTTAHSSSSWSGAIGSPDGALTNGPTWQQEDMCVTGRCLYFDGVDDYVEVDDHHNLDTAKGWSIGGWFKANRVDVTGRQLLISKWNNSGGQSTNYSLEIDSNSNARVGISHNTTMQYLDSQTELKSNHWHHLVATFDGQSGSLKIYVDGRFDGELATGLSEAGTNNAALRLGSFNFTYEPNRDEYQGFMDEVKIYNHTRTQSQIQQDYVAGMTSLQQQGGNLSNGLVGYWKMDEVSWNGATNDVQDGSGNAHHLTSRNGANTGVGVYGNGGTFDGVDDYTSRTSVATGSSGLALGVGEDLTVSTWFRVSSFAGSYMHLVNNGWSTSEGYFIRIYSTSKQFQVKVEDSSDVKTCNNPNGLTAAETLATDQWYHGVMTWDGSAKVTRIYLNGQLLGECQDSAISDTSYTDSIALGAANGGGAPFAGTMDETRIYKRTLSSTEVQQLYSYAPKPVGYWDFEDHSTGSGQEGVVYDKSGNGHDGVWSGAGSRYSMGRAGKSGEFNGVDSGISMGDVLDFPTNDFTISAWIKPKNLAKTIAVVAKKNSFVINPSDAGYGLSITSEGHLRFNLGDGTVPGATIGGTAGASLTPYLNSWVHVAASISRVSGGTSYLYINGAVVSSSTSFHSKGSASNDLEFKIGSIPENNYFYDGAIDEVNIYNYARTQQQIIEDMQAGQPAVNSPIGHWKFDEGQGGAAYDSSAFGNNGSIGCVGVGCINPQWTTDSISKHALNFGGSDSTHNSQVLVSPDKLHALADVSVSAWIKPSSNYSDPNGTIIRNGVSTQLEYGISYQPSAKRIHFRWYDGEFHSIYTENNSIEEDVWQHVVAVRSGLRVYIYIDGRLSTASNVTLPTTASSSLTIGRTANEGVPEDFSGIIDEVKIYNHSLTPQDILVDYNHSSAMVAGNTSTEPTTSDSSQPASKPSNSAGSEYCVPGSDDYCAPPVGEWKFESKDGVTVEDSSGNGNNTTLSDGAVIDAGKLGKAGNFSENLGAFAQPISGNLPDLTAADGSFTAMAWVNRLGVIDYGGTAGGGILGTRTQGGIGVNIIGTNSLGNQIGTISQYHSIAENEWQHVVLVYDGTAGTTSLFINGVLLSSKNAPAVFTQFGSASGLTIGNSHWRNTRFNGKVDEVRFYNYVRTPAQIAWDYNKGKPIAHYKFDECQGNTIHDSSGNGLHGILNLGVGGETNIGTCDSLGAWSLGKTGKYNSGMSFDGVDDYISLENDGRLNLRDGLSIGMWVKMDNLGYQQKLIAARGEDSSPTPFDLRLSHGKVQFNYYNDSTWQGINDSGLLSVGRWGHIVVTKNDDSSLVSVYVDGVLVNQKSVSGRSSSIGSNPIFISKSGEYYNAFNGQIDDVQIFNYALTDEQVKVLYNGGAVRWE